MESNGKDRVEGKSLLYGLIFEDGMKRWGDVIIDRKK